MKTNGSTRPRPRAAKQRRVVPPDAAQPPLPHERDESPEPEGAPRAIIAKAKDDLDEGRVDTDNYTRARDVTRHALAGRRRRSRT
jgi:hypothetical protein